MPRELCVLLIGVEKCCMMLLVLAEQSRNLHLYLVRVIPIEQEVHRTYTKWLPLRVVQREI